MSQTTTIAALATAPFPAGLAVVRISGPRARRAFASVFRSSQDPLLDPRRLILGYLVESGTCQLLSDAMAVFMPAPHSFTGEDVVELQFLGSPLLIQKVLRSLYSLGIDPAQPGEFTKRAFLNGKLDLTQAEAIASLASATSEAALKVAGEHLKGRFSTVIEDLAEPLRDTLAEVEASVDFPDEDILPARRDELALAASRALTEIERLLETYAYGHHLREGFRVLLCGRVNAGKSSILNLLLGRERAIVSDVSGTTRDLIEEEATFAGYHFVFCDSAGIRETDDTVEKIGVELALERLDWADLVLFIVDATDTGDEWRALLEVLHTRAARLWMVINKLDLNPAAPGAIVCDSNICARNFYLSAKNKAGLAELTQAMVEEVMQSLPDSSQTGQIVTNERHRTCLERAKEALHRVKTGLAEGVSAELTAADLRDALNALEEIIGKTWTEDILGRIFSKFCIGK